MKKLVSVTLFSAIAALSSWAAAQSNSTAAPAAAPTKVAAVDPYASAGVYDRCMSVTTNGPLILVTAGKDPQGRWYSCGKNSGMTIMYLPPFFAQTLASGFCDKSKPISSMPVGEDGRITIYCTYNGTTSFPNIEGYVIKVV